VFVVGPGSALLIAAPVGALSVPVITGGALGGVLGGDGDGIVDGAAHGGMVAADGVTGDGIRDERSPSVCVYSTDCHAS
jgi:hypothetical protein